MAGPVVSAAVILPEHFPMDVLKDSKMLTAKIRESLFDQIQRECNVGIGIVTSQMVDRLNVLQATLFSMKKAILRLHPVPDEILVDGNQIPKMPDRCIQSFVKGDQFIPVISAASIVAKVIRDRLMEKLHRRYPLYDFCRHKGYGTELHFSRIFEFGPSPVHRKTFNQSRQLSFCNLTVVSTKEGDAHTTDIK